jgi:hypothetical protein
MKRFFLLFLSFSASVALGQTGIPWTPVNLTGSPVSVLVVDSYGNVTGAFVVSVGQSGTLWVPVPAGAGSRRCRFPPVPVPAGAGSRRWRCAIGQSSIDAG